MNKTKSYQSNKIRQKLVIPALFMAIFMTIWINKARSQDTRSTEEIRKSPQSIVDYYLLLPVLGFELSDEHEDLIALRKKYIATYSPLIDNQNAYFHMEDQVSELTRSVTITYFKKKSGEKVIGVSEYFAGGDCDTYSTQFYQYTDGKWNNVTQQVLSSYTFKEFSMNYISQNIEKYMDIDQNINWEYTLPQHGTTVTVTPIGLGEGICFNYPYSFASGEEYNQIIFELYPGLITGRSYESRQLKWNKELGVFEKLGVN